MAPERTKTVSLRLPADLVAEFDGVARAAGKTRTEAVERAMRAVIAASRTPRPPIIRGETEPLVKGAGRLPRRQRDTVEPRFKS